MRVAMSAIVATLFVCGCSTPKPMERDEYLRVTTRTYEGKTKDQVIDAALKVLSLSHQQGFELAHNDDGFGATHHPFEGRLPSDNWEFKVRDTSAGPRASVQIFSMAGGGATILPTSSPGIYSVGSTPSSTAIVQGNAAYDLFWARVDYFLWERDTWATCVEESAKIDAGKVYGSLDPLCGRAFPDDTPGRPRNKAPAFATATNGSMPSDYGTSLPIVIAPDRSPR